MKKQWSNFMPMAMAAALLFAGCTNPSTPAGQEGYVYEDPRIWGTGGFQGVMIGPANFGMSIWRNRVVNVDMRAKTYDERFRILTQDDLNVEFAFHTVVSIKAGTVQEVVERYGGEEWYVRFLRQPLRTFVRQSVQIHASKDIKALREMIASEVWKLLEGYLKETPFQVVSAVVGDVDYPKIVTEAVEKKLAAQQLLEEKATRKEIASRDAEIRVEEAKGIAEAQRIINATLTPNYLQHEAISAQLKMSDSPNHTTVYIPVGTNGIPLVRTVAP